MSLKIHLPVWMNKGDPARLAIAAVRHWETMYQWLKFPIMQFDPLTCDERLLFLYAYQRDVRRLNSEPLTLYRKRIKYAYANAADSGSVAGFKNIFERLEIGTVQILERQHGYDWDVIILRLSDNQLTNNRELLTEIIRQYGRTCRRYFFEIVHVQPMKFRCGEFKNNQHYNGSKFDFKRMHQATVILKVGGFGEVKEFNGAQQ